MVDIKKQSNTNKSRKLDGPMIEWLLMVIPIGIFIIFLIVDLAKLEIKAKDSTTVIREKTVVGEIVGLKEEYHTFLPDDNIILVRIDDKVEEIINPTDAELLLCKKHEGEKAKVKVQICKDGSKDFSILDVGENIENK